MNFIITIIKNLHYIIVIACSNYTTLLDIDEHKISQSVI